MATVVQPALVELLKMSGARTRGRRADCPDCGSKRTVSVDESKDVFFCHHAGCGFHGGIATLRRRLGIERQWLPRGEYIRLQRGRERADRLALDLYERVKARRFKLLDELHSLNRLELLAHDAGPNNPESWGALARVYAERPGLLAELLILENSTAAALIRFLSADSEVRERAIAGVIESGGLWQCPGRFVELAF